MQHLPDKEQLECFWNRIKKIISKAGYENYVFYYFIPFLSTCVKIYNAICTPLHRSKAFL